MPAAMEYITDTHSEAYKALEKAHVEEVREREKRVKLHWDYYDGKMPRPLKIEKDRVDDNIILAKVDQIADKTISFLLGDGISFDVGGDDDKSTPGDDLVAQLWQENRGQMLLHNIALSGVMAGHVFVRLEPREGQMPRIVNLAPEQCAVFWPIDDIEATLWYRLQYVMGPQAKRIDYVKGSWNGREVDHEADGWLEFVYRRDPDTGNEWVMRGEPKVLDWPFPPIIDWQNMPRPFNRYGADDIRRAVMLNNAVNFVASNFNRTLKHHAHPRTVGLGFEASAIQSTEIGGLFTINKSKTEADMFNLEMQSDLSSSTGFLAFLLRELWQSARLVDPQSLHDRISTLTNFGLRVLYNDAISKTDTKRLLYGEGFETIAKRALLMANKAVPEKVATKWATVLPEDTEAEIKAGLEEVGAGVLDKQTYSEERGRDWEKISERLEDEKASETNFGTLVLGAFNKGA